jgi:hypothetical protein
MINNEQNVNSKRTKKPSAFTQFLWWTAGADQEILMRSTHSDRVKYLTLGGIILATGLMAALAGGYAFYTIFSPKGDALGDLVPASASTFKQAIHIPTTIYSIVFGCFWGLIIFNIDRFIVTSTGTGDGTEKITWDEFKSAIPRLVMGAIIAITISKPVEIRMFQSEIDAQLHKEQQKQVEIYEESTRAKYSKDLTRLDMEINKIVGNEGNLLNDVKKAENELTLQLQGKAGAPAGDGKLSDALRKLRDGKLAQLNNYKNSIQPEIKKLKNDYNLIIEKQNLELGNNSKVAASLDGLLERIKIAHEIAGWVITTFITLLFMAIELTPIFFKLMLIKSPYDYLVENQKELVKANDGIHIEYNYYPPEDDKGVMREGTERHLVRLLEKEKINLEKLELLEAQKRLTKYALGKFEEQQRKLIDENPEQYIKVTHDGLTDDKTA